MNAQHSINAGSRTAWAVLTAGGRAVPARRLAPAAVGYPRPRFAPGERVLTGETDTAGRAALATDRGLYRAAGSDTQPTWSRLGWEEILRVSWDRGTGVLSMTGLPAGVPETLRLPARTRLPALVRERVQAAALTSVRVRLPDTGTACLWARRRPGTGEVVWVAALDGTADPEDPQVQDRLCAAIHEIRVQAGI